MQGFAAGDLHQVWSLLRRIVFSDIGDEEEQYIHTVCFVFDWHDDVFHLQELLERSGIGNAGFLRSARISDFEAVIPDRPGCPARARECQMVQYGRARLAVPCGFSSVVNDSVA